MIKLVIFDLDGVLVHACEWHRVALNYALKTCQNYEISLKDHETTYNGLPTRTKLAILTEKGLIKSDSHQEIFEIKQKITIDIIKKQSKVRQEKVDLMNYLKNKGLLVACFTNSIRETAELMLETSGVASYLDLVLTNEDVECPKPDPEGYKKICEHFKVDPKEVFIVEDSDKGYASAVASGCHVLRVKDPEEVMIKLFKERI
tara:strand:- start:1105 stop:1713 length:609 start_codon:yes stop_codon:yes gene_type:complete